MDSQISWDALRKQARKLEAQLDEQMSSYRRLVATKADGSENDLESGIDQLLKQLQQVISHMQAWVSSGGSEIFSHTLTRHQEILHDLTQEFYRLRSSLRAKREHASLLQDFGDFDRARVDLEENGGFEGQALLKEQAAVSRSTGQMDTVISQAQSTLGSLPSPFGKSYPVCNQEEKVNGYHHPFPGCICVHISHSDLLVDKVRSIFMTVSSHGVTCTTFAGEHDANLISLCDLFLPPMVISKSNVTV
ncbi:hypothetical protein MRB53_017918 [Persea americana]|uniref:Uncharacterized protein n=1 Tax=Persea americana TaxID=3435 RepID=A0ACC2M6K7_PERAE|nr:hypothetical protein MRB53_017918 [Persea americana]